MPNRCRVIVLEEQNSSGFKALLSASGTIYSRNPQKLQFPSLSEQYVASATPAPVQSGMIVDATTYKEFYCYKSCWDFVSSLKPLRITCAPPLSLHLILFSV